MSRARSADDRGAQYSRWLLLACSVVAVALLVASLRDHDRCGAARSAVFVTGDRAAIGDLRATCRGAGALADVAGALHARRRDREALALAREAATREPRNAGAWRAIALTAAAQAPAEARAAERRRRVLDPLG